MMSKLTVAMLACVLSLALMSQLSESKTLANDAVVAADKSNLVSNQKEDMHTVSEQQRDEMIEAMLMRKLLRELINQAEADAEDDEDDESSDIEVEFVKKRGIEKRFPKWRTGDTRTRMHNLIDLNDFSSPRAQHGDYSHQLRRLWEKNMVEKNKMYQNLQNLYGRRK